MYMSLFRIGEYTVQLLDVVVFAACLVIVLGLLIFIIADIKRSNRKRREAADSAAEASASGGVVISPDKKAGKKSGRKSGKKSGERGRRRGDDEPIDPIVAILGFDPYAPFDSAVVETDDGFVDAEHETEDMRVLRGTMNSAKETEAKKAELKERKERVLGELNKTARFLRDNRIVFTSSAAASDKLQSEIATLSADKKSQRTNRAEIARLTEAKAVADSRAAEVGKAVEKRAEDERLLKEALAHLDGEIARADRDLRLYNADIERLNASVGAELKQIESENRARALMNKYSQLKPLLVGANSAYREIVAIDAKLGEVRAKKRDARVRLERLSADLKVAYGPHDTEETASGIAELTAQMVKLDEEESTRLADKEKKIREYRSAKRKANEFVEEERYSLDDIVAAEDKVVGELEYERLKAEYAEKKKLTAEKFAAAQKKYDEIMAKKVRIKKKDAEGKLAREAEIQSALAELKAARTESEKAADDFDRVLPSLTPSSLITSGSGVLSRERISGRVRSSAAQSNGANVPAARGSGLPTTDTVSAAALRKLMERLNALERFVLGYREMKQRTEESRRYGGDEGSKLERRRAQVVALRKNLKYIDSPKAANEFRQKLYRLSISLDEDEMNDNVLSEMIRRTMNEAAYLGEKAARGGSYRNMK